MREITEADYRAAEKKLFELPEEVQDEIFGVARELIDPSLRNSFEAIKAFVVEMMI